MDEFIPEYFSLCFELLFCHCSLVRRKKGVYSPLHSMHPALPDHDVTCPPALLAGSHRNLQADPATIVLSWKLGLVVDRDADMPCLPS